MSVPKLFKSCKSKGEVEAFILGLVKVFETFRLVAVVEANVESPVTERVPESEAFERVESPVTERVPESEAFERR